MIVQEPLLEVRDLRTYFHTEEGVGRAVDGVSFSVGKGKTLGIVGESGCGKSVSALSVMRLVADPPGRIEFGQILNELLNLFCLCLNIVLWYLCIEHCPGLSRQKQAYTRACHVQSIQHL